MHYLPTGQIGDRDVRLDQVLDDVGDDLARPRFLVAPMTSDPLIRSPWDAGRLHRGLDQILVEQIEMAPVLRVDIRIPEGHDDEASHNHPSSTLQHPILITGLVVTAVSPAPDSHSIDCAP